jgi:hypothetical protein
MPVNIKQAFDAWEGRKANLIIINNTVASSVSKFIIIPFPDAI